MPPNAIGYKEKQLTGSSHIFSQISSVLKNIYVSDTLLQPSLNTFDTLRHPIRGSGEIRRGSCSESSAPLRIKWGSGQGAHMSPFAKDWHRGQWTVFVWIWRLSPRRLRHPACVRGGIWPPCNILLFTLSQKKLFLTTELGFNKPQLLVFAWRLQALSCLARNGHWSQRWPVLVGLLLGDLNQQ